MKNTAGLVLAISALTILFASSVNAAGDASKGETLSITCAACHGGTGNSPIPNQPSIAGQGEKYLLKQLKDFQSGARQNAIMAPMVKGLSEQDLADLSAFYASQSISYSIVDEEFIKEGQRLYFSGDTDRDIPACAACHGATGDGMSSAGFPALGGQHPEYTSIQLKAFRSGERDNDASKVMQDVVAKMSDKQIEAISHYLAGLHADIEEVKDGEKKE